MPSPCAAAQIRAEPLFCCALRRWLTLRAGALVMPRSGLCSASRPAPLPRQRQPTAQAKADVFCQCARRQAERWVFTCGRMAPCRRLGQAQRGPTQEVHGIRRVAAGARHSGRAERRSASADEGEGRVGLNGATDPRDAHNCGVRQDMGRHSGAWSEVLVHALRLCTLRARRAVALLDARRHPSCRADKRSASASKHEGSIGLNGATGPHGVHDCGGRSGQGRGSGTCASLMYPTSTGAWGEVLVHALRLCTLRAREPGARSRYMRFALSALRAQCAVALFDARRHPSRRADKRSASAGKDEGSIALNRATGPARCR